MWRDLPMECLTELREHISKNGRMDGERLIMPVEPRTKRTLELLLLTHKVRENMVVVEKDEAYVLIRCLGLAADLSMKNIDIYGP